jgi:AraC-like DNA-binding protein
MSTSSGSTPATEYLALDELCPSVDLASCFEFREETWFTYGIPGHHLILLERGRLEARTPWGKFKAAPGDLLCFRPTPVNRYGVFGTTIFYQAHVLFGAPPRQHLTPWLDDAGPLPLQMALGSAFPEARELFESIIQELPHSGAAHKLRIRAAVFKLLEIVARKSARAEATTERLDAWQRARLRLGSQLDREMSISQLAKSMGLSADHFIRQFKQRFGMTPKAYRTHLKLREAARQIRSGGTSIKAVAYSLGFSDTKAFSRIFKRYLGVIPSEFDGAKDTAAPGASEVSRGKLYPINQHVAPPHVDQRWYEKYAARG